ncbi:MAG TPA: AAA family ATPase [Casimicrobiaceae bacterium]|nr:AAA family ATPase [Casimicrobiaceae bacterium]
MRRVAPRRRAHARAERRGKTTLSARLLERTGAIRVRTDVERKRLSGLAAEARTGSGLDGGLYAPDRTRRTYQHVLACAESIVVGGFAALVDGAFLQRWQRESYAELARRYEASFLIVDCIASESTLRARVSARANVGRDASEANLAVLENQLATAEPLSCEELRYTMTCDAESPFESGISATAWRNIVDRFRAGGAPLASAHARLGPDVELADKVVRLCRPGTYATATGVVEAIETHLSWVFLTDAHAYKLKKPVREELVDLRTLDARRRNSLKELEVNARFSRGVYLDIVPLVSGGDGGLRVAGVGTVVDWLVRMRRLPSAKMLDRVIASGRFDVSALVPVVETLCRAYSNARVSVDQETYRRRIRDMIRATERELCRPELDLPLDTVKRIAAQQCRFAERDGRFEARVRESRIVEGHGDLRPEHICLEATPQIIDALESSRELRRVDAIDELGFLSLECARLGAPEARSVVFDLYRHYTGDPAPDAIIHFYQSFRGLVRARLAIRHLLDEDARDRNRWPVQARCYLDLAFAHIERCE